MRSPIPHHQKKRQEECLLSLPPEILDVVVQVVRSNDETWKRLAFRKAQDELGRVKRAKTWDGYGVNALMLSCLQLREHCVPLVFDTLRTSQLRIKPVAFEREVATKYRNYFKILVFDSPSLQRTRNTLTLVDSLLLPNSLTTLQLNGDVFTTLLPSSNYQTETPTKTESELEESLSKLFTPFTDVVFRDFDVGNWSFVGPFFRRCRKLHLVGKTRRFGGIVDPNAPVYETPFPPTDFPFSAKSLTSLHMDDLSLAPYGEFWEFVGNINSLRHLTINIINPNLPDYQYPPKFKNLLILNVTGHPNHVLTFLPFFDLAPLLTTLHINLHSLIYTGPCEPEITVPVYLDKLTAITITSALESFDFSAMKMMKVFMMEAPTMKIRLCLSDGSEAEGDEKS